MWWIKNRKTGREMLFFGGEFVIFRGENGENYDRSCGKQGDSLKVFGDKQIALWGDIWGENVDKCPVSVDNSD